MSIDLLPLRFVAKFVPAPSGCWQWTASSDHDGYGQFWWEGRVESAHRAAWLFLRGQIPAGLQIDHLCRNRRCVNPLHLQTVTQRENMLRGTGMAARNAQRTRCVNGHPFAPGNVYMTTTGMRKCRECTRIRHRRLYKTAYSPHLTEGEEG